jgi:hypothetical protein
MDRFDIFGCAIIEELQRRLSRDRYNNVIYLSRNQPEIGENLEIAKVTAARPNWINGSRETGRTQVLHP